MYQSPDAGKVLELLEHELSTLPPAHRLALEHSLIAPRKLLVDDSSGEFVIAVAAFGDKLLYWSDLEEGWELEIPSEADKIPFRGCNQFELRHVLYQLFGPADAV